MSNDLIYQIFIQSFVDSNGDGIGDINGITSKLDYLSGLGITTLWLSPIHPSPSYHKYDVTDFYCVHPDYGNIEDLKDLILEAHKKNIKIIIDLVLNHCSKEHPWFQSAISGDAKYKDYFVWSTLEETEAKGSLIKEKTGDSDNELQWNKVENQDELYFSYFWEGMPDLNYDNEHVKEEAFKIGLYWLSEIGVDGFRLDAAKHIFPDNRENDTLEFWRTFKSKMQAVNSDVILLGEVWSDIHNQASYTKSFSSLFNFDLSYSILETIKQKKILGASVYSDSWKLHERLSLVDIIKTSKDIFNTYNSDFFSTIFLSNHDQERTQSFLENDEDKAKLAACILLTLPGCPCIYYGEELGMKGKKPDEYIREPFPWSNDDFYNTSWIQPKYNTSRLLDPLSIQQTDSNSIYQRYKTLVALRKGSATLANGSIDSCDLDDEQILAYERKDENSNLLVIHNLSSSAKFITTKKTFREIYYTSSLELIGNIDSFVLSPYSSIILLK